MLLTLPSILVYKISEVKNKKQEQNKRKVAERQLTHLNHKIDKLLNKLEEQEPELAISREECAICITAKAVMQTFPCGHRVVCRKCFVKTIQITISQRVLPLRCVICRTKIIQLRQASHDQNASTQFDSSRSNRDMKIETHNLDKFSSINTVLKEPGDMPVYLTIPNQLQKLLLISTKRIKFTQ
ncbi:uncharacterized protein LOC143230316 isoform X1 [Tachypleus tridentatus]|uniref:uncharacterized protein LOC143230316 isoform X1 n=1 Tax=Tachypleus tridentatus TaxID=6853 RepID=UPI003FD6527E